MILKLEAFQLIGVEYLQKQVGFSEIDYSVYQKVVIIPVLIKTSIFVQCFGWYNEQMDMGKI